MKPPIAGAPHPHEIPYAGQHHVAIGPIAKRSRLAPTQVMDLVAPVDDRPLGGARENEAHPRDLGHRGRESRSPALDLVGVQRLRAVEKIDEGIRACGYHADAVALIRLALRALLVDRVGRRGGGKGSPIGPPVP